MKNKRYLPMAVLAAAILSTAGDINCNGFEDDAEYAEQVKIGETYQKNVDTCRGVGGVPVTEVFWATHPDSAKHQRQSYEKLVSCTLPCDQRKLTVEK